MAEKPLIEVFNYQTNAAEAIPEDRIEQAVLSGNYGLRKDLKVGVISPEGIAGTVSPKELPEALKSGFKYETGVEREKRKLREAAEQQVGITALEGLASGASLGLSDKIETEIFGVDPKEIEARKEANPGTRITSEIVGAVAPNLVTGGTTTAGKAAAAAVKTLGAPARAAVGAGKIVENKLAKTVFKNVIADPANRTLAQKIAARIPQTAGSLVEGTAFGLGELVKEEALGNAEINAESLFSYAGMGGALGGGTGAVFGGFAALAPKVAEAGKAVSGKLKNVYANKGVALTEYLGLKGKNAQRVLDNKNLQQDIIEVLKKHDTSIVPDSSKLSTQLTKVKEAAASKISQAYKTLDAGMNRVGLFVNRQNFYRPLINQLNEEISKRAGRRSESKLTQVLKDYRDDLIDLKNSKKRLSFTEMWDERRALDSKINFKQLREDFNEITDIRYNLRTTFKNNINQTAESVGGQIEGFEKVSKILQDANKDYSVISLIEKGLTSKASKDNILGLKDFIRGGIGYAIGGQTGLAIAGTKKFLESDLRRRFVIFGGIEKGQKLFEKTLKKSVDNFLSANAQLSKPVTLQALLKSGMAVDPDTKKKPKDRDQAYRNTVKLLNKFERDPEFLNSRVQSAVSRVAQAAPNTAAAAQITMIKAANFLQQKVPKRGAFGGFLDVLQQEIPLPSNVEMSKFENYVAVIDNPAVVLEQLDAGTITRESVEAVKAVYPELYQKIRQETMIRIQEDPTGLSYSKKIQLGILLDIPADASLLPQNVLALQQNFTEAQVEEQSRSVKPTQGGLKNIKAAGRAQTDTQRIQSEAK